MLPLPSCWQELTAPDRLLLSFKLWATEETRSTIFRTKYITFCKTLWSYSADDTFQTFRYGIALRKHQNIFLAFYFFSTKMALGIEIFSHGQRIPLVDETTVASGMIFQSISSDPVCSYSLVINKDNVCRWASPLIYISPLSSVKLHSSLGLPHSSSRVAIVWVWDIPSNL